MPVETITKHINRTLKLFIPDTRVTPQDLRRILITDVWNHFTCEEAATVNLMDQLAEYLCTSVQMFRQHYVCENRGIHQARLVEFASQAIATSQQSQENIRGVVACITAAGIESPFDEDTQGAASSSAFSGVGVEKIQLKRYSMLAELNAYRCMYILFLISDVVERVPMNTRC